MPTRSSKLSFQLLKYEELDELYYAETEDPQGLYLEISFDGTALMHIPYTEFKTEYHKAEIKSVNPSERELINGSIPTGDGGEPQLKFRNVAEFLLKKAGINVNGPQLQENSRLDVRSNIPEILDLPWEGAFINKTIYVIRVYLGNKNDNELGMSDGNNLLILMSHAHKGERDDLKKGIDKEVRSIYDALHFLREQNQQTFRTENILLSKHTTQQVVERLNWQDYNLVHFLMHGDNDGYLLLEHPGQSYKTPVYYSFSNLVDILGDEKFYLIFFSMCNAGSQMDRNCSLANRLVKDSVARYTIGYEGSVNNRYAKSFSQIFYKSIITGDPVEKVYTTALEKYYRENPDTQYIPYLYMKA